MGSDRITKVLIAMIALGIWALTMTQVGTPVSTVHASATPHLAPEASSAPGLPSAGEGQTVRASTSSLPLRWRVRYAMLLDNNESDCVTVINVHNLAPSSTTVDVQWLDTDSLSVALRSQALAPGKHLNLIPMFSGGSIDSSSDPFIYVDWVEVLGNFEGSARVFSDDPRVSVTAFLKCDTSPSDSDPSSIAHIPCDPIGATMEYFQAGMPADWPPPMALPEVPE